MRRPSLVLVFLVAALPLLNGADNSDYRTPETAIPAKIQSAVGPAAAGPVPYLGVPLQPDAMGRLVIDDVQPDSPAEKAGLQLGDVLTRLDGKEVGSVDTFKAVLRAKAPGNSLKVALTRSGKPVEA